MKRGLKQDAFDEGHYNTAYHALAAALYWAQDSNDPDLCAIVEGTANAQAQLIDRNAPDYEHSSQSAQRRGVTDGGLFTHLSRQAKVAASFIRTLKL